MAAINQSVQSVHTQEKNQQYSACQSQSQTTAALSTASIAHGKRQPLTERQIRILEERGINIELAVKMGWRSEGLNDTDNLLAIPYFRNGKEVNCKTRTIEGEKRFYQVKDAEKCLYNVDILQEQSDLPLIICEGEMDCLIALQCGYRAVSVPDGAPKVAIGDRDTIKYTYLADIPKSIKTIILAVDMDPAGEALKADLSLRLGRERCQSIIYPRGCKDLNDAFKAYGAKGVHASIAKAQFMDIDGLYRLADLPPLQEETPCHVGIKKLEEHLRIRRGDFSVVTGIPSHGKSTFVNHITFNLAKLSNWNICFASFEQPPQTEHLRALRTLHAERPSYLLEQEEIKKADDFINKHFSFIVPLDDSDEEFDLTWLQDRMVMAVTKYKADMIIIDPWNEIEHDYDQRSMSLTQYVGKAIRGLKHFARRYNVHVMVVAHPAKMKKDKDGFYPIPTPYDISDSSHWYNKPEQCIIVHRTENNNSLIKIAKSRYHYALGTPAEVELKFNSYNGRYESYFS